MCYALQDIQDICELWHQDLDDVLVHGILKHLQQKYKVGGQQLKVFGSLVERVKSGLDFQSQLNEDIQRGKDFQARHGDSPQKAAVFAASEVYRGFYRGFYRRNSTTLFVLAPAQYIGSAPGALDL